MVRKGIKIVVIYTAEIVVFLSLFVYTKEGRKRWQIHSYMCSISELISLKDGREMNKKIVFI